MRSSTVEVKVPAGLCNQIQLNLCTAVETYATLKIKAKRGSRIVFFSFFPGKKMGPSIQNAASGESPEFKLHLTLATADSLDPHMQFSAGNTVLHTLRRK